MSIHVPNNPFRQQATINPSRVLKLASYVRYLSIFHDLLILAINHLGGLFMEIVKLEVGERKFKCYKDTLTSGSEYFRTRYKERWAAKEEAADVANDGYRFIDRDGNLFEHILAFLRSGEPPIFYDNANGHDLMMYRRLYVEARYYGIDELAKWLEEKEYARYISVEKSVQLHDCPDREVFQEQTHGSGSIQMSVISVTENAYLCPRGIVVHKNQPSRCGQDCRKKWVGNGPVWTRAKVLKMVEMREEVKIDPVAVYGSEEERVVESIGEDSE